jgi:FtsH-binding integral membrane protein
MFAGVSAVAFSSKRDFSFKKYHYHRRIYLNRTYRWRMIFGFNLGLWFSVGMVILASATILYQTSKLKDSLEQNSMWGGITAFCFYYAFILVHFKYFNEQKKLIEIL